MTSRIIELELFGINMPYHQEIINLEAWEDHLGLVLAQTVAEAQNRMVWSPKLIIRVTQAPAEADLSEVGGVGASCSSPELIEIRVDPRYPQFENNVRLSLLHELHHTARRFAGIDISHSTFGECLWSEGLADYFVWETTGQRTCWSHDLSPDEYQRLTALAQASLTVSMTDQLYDEWFLSGSPAECIPRFAGYALGFMLVQEYCTKQSQTVANLTTLKAPL